MKRSLILIATIFVALVLKGCNYKNIKPMNYDSLVENEKGISYRVDQISLSKTFQSTDSSIEVIPKRNTAKIIASLGLTESSGVKINKLIKNDNNIDIHVSSIYEEGNLQLAVPQIVLEIKTPRSIKAENLQFNIVKDDYKPLTIKMGINEVLSKIESHFKVSPNGAPTVDLTRFNDNIIWDITYNSIFDRDNPQTPLINLSTSVDANSGDILESKKTFISSSIDEGHVLDYKPDQYILYKKSINNLQRDTEEQLWSYDISTKEKNMLFSSNFKIHNAVYSPDLSHISLIEASDNGTGLYIIPTEDQKAYKTSFEDVFNPQIMSWKNEDNLYLIENTGTNSIVFSHQVVENLTSRVASVDKPISDLKIQDDNFLLVEKSENKYNQKIYMTSNWKKFDFIDDGFKPNYIDDGIIGYLKNNEGEDTDSLLFYNLKEEKLIKEIAENVKDFQITSDKNISYTKKNPNYNNFALVEYSLTDGKSRDVASLVGGRVYYNPDQKIIYANLVLPFENEKSEIIYSIDLSKLN